MPIPIRAEGLFYGERMHRCSNNARLWFAYFFLGSNNAARIRLHYPDMLRTCFAGFKPPPSSDEMMAMFHEYQRNYLIFLYRDKPTGQLWGQWDTESIARFAARDAAKSPAPPQEAFDKWRQEYYSAKCAPTLSTQVPFGDSPRVTESHGDSPRVTESHGESPRVTESHGDSPLIPYDSISYDSIKTKPSAFALPEWINPELWEAFEEMRKKIRKPLTDKARALTIRELEQLQVEGNPPSAVLEQSIQNAWQGVFPLRSNPRPGAHASKQPQHGTSRDASSIADDRRKARESNAAAKS